jgi:hypothetical protein
MVAEPNTPLYKLPQPVTSTIVTVTLDDGTTVERAPGQLIQIPAGLVHPLETYAAPT